MIAKTKWWLLAAVAGVAVVVMVFALVFARLAAARVPVQIDLVGTSDTVQRSYSYPVEASLDQYIASRTFTIDGETRNVLFMHPPSSASFSLLLPRTAVLQFGMAIQPEAWDKSGDGVDFQVNARFWDEAAKRNEDEIVYSHYMDPKNDPSMRHWVDAVVDLNRLGGNYVTLVFRTMPHASPDYDWAGWSGICVTGR